MSSKAITVYRTPATTSVPQISSKPLYGILKALPEHKCSLPGFWQRLWRGVRRGDLFRCSCGKVHEWRNIPSNILFDGWRMASIEDWVAAGGAKEEELELELESDRETRA